MLPTFALLAGALSMMLYVLVGFECRSFWPGRAQLLHCGGGVCVHVLPYFLYFLCVSCPWHMLKGKQTEAKVVGAKKHHG